MKFREPIHLTTLSFSRCSLSLCVLLPHHISLPSHLSFHIPLGCALLGVLSTAVFIQRGTNQCRHSTRHFWTAYERPPASSHLPPDVAAICTWPPDTLQASVCRMQPTCPTLAHAKGPSLPLPLGQSPHQTPCLHTQSSDRSQPVQQCHGQSDSYYILSIRFHESPNQTL